MMKRQAFIWLVAAFSLLVSQAAFAQQKCDEEVSGQVVDVSTGETVESARVELRVEAESKVVRSDGSGEFKIEGVCKGEGLLSVARPDYETVTQSVTIPTETVAVTLEPRRVDRLDDVIVEAPAPPETNTRASTTLSEKDLEESRGRELADTLSRVPGVSVLGGGGGTAAKPIIRGQYGRRLLILYDGVRHEGQKWGVDHAPEIDPFSAGSITVVKGAGTVLYGPDAIGGLIRIDPPPLPTTPGVGGVANLIGISNGKQVNGALRLEGAHEILPGFAWATDGNYLRSAALMTPNYPLDNTGTEQWNLGATVGYDDNGFQLKLTHRRHYRKAGICRCVQTDNPDDFFVAAERGEPKNVELYSASYEIDRPYQEVQHNLWLARAGVDFDHAGKASLTYAFQSDDRQEYGLVRSNITSPQADFFLTTHSVRGVYEQPEFALSGHSSLVGSVGIDFGFQENVFKGLPLIPNHRAISYGAFAMERLLAGPVEVEAGLRMDFLSRDAFLTKRNFTRLTNTADVDIDSVGCELTDKAAKCPSDFASPSATLGALWTLNDLWSMRLNLSSAIRFPNPDEQYINGTAPTSPIFAVGDPSLGPERTWGSTLTGYFDGSWITTELSGYFNYTDDYIYLAPQILDDGTPGFEVLITGTYPRFTTRPVNATFYGADGLITVRPNEWPVELRTQFAVVRGVNQTENVPLIFVPADRIEFGLRYSIPNFLGFKNGYAEANVQLVDTQRNFDPSTDLVDPPPGYALLGAQVGVERPIAKQLLTIGIEGRNLTNAVYREYTSLRRYFADEPGIEVALRIGLRFGARADSDSTEDEIAARE